MKKRGVHSPDRADAVFGAMTPVRRIQSYNLIDHTYANANADNGAGPWDGFEGQWKVFGENEPKLPDHIPGSCVPLVPTDNPASSNIAPFEKCFRAGN